MVERHRIHPMDVEAPLPPPLSHYAAKIAQQPPLSHSKLLLPLPEKQRKQRRRSCCWMCLCWSFLALIILVVVIADTLGILYLAFDPKIPKYSVDRLSIANFSVDPNMMISAAFNIRITATSPNKRIDIYYLDGSRLSAWYTNTSLCTGRFPEFCQGHQNTTVLDVLLAGETELGSGLLQELLQQQHVGTISLLFRGVVPVKMKPRRLKLPNVTFKVRASMLGQAIYEYLRI
ncbi:NDR1/HIN1-like protein 6 [Canna indica]|uniref:NDR1/HIN1-like protein 6 n=1 Tax=Canna indica TaxID=4628 RepID=A0AAQ3K4G9_9LILI|nr:NDR1/HIN1-like protein 6 [Canna indica]